jgi:hypothetical protein
MTNLIPLRIYLQLEGLVAVVVLTLVYRSLHFSGWLYALLFFTPDLFMLGYLVDKRVGATIYNLGHTYVVPALLIGAGLLLHETMAVAVGLIWSAHIGFDRLMGYGLKCNTGFRDTHLQKV